MPIYRHLQYMEIWSARAIVSTTMHVRDIYSMGWPAVKLFGQYLDTHVNGLKGTAWLLGPCVSTNPSLQSN